MPSDWGNILSIPFVGGIDTKSDPKSVQMGRLIELENGVFTRRGSIRKRYGSDKIKLRESDLSDIDDSQVVTACENELLLTSLEKVYSYDSGNQKFLDKGLFKNIHITSTEVSRSTNEQTEVDRAEANGVIAYAWNDSRGGVRYTVIDKTTGAKFIDDVEISATGADPRCIKVGSFIHVIYTETGSTDLDAIVVNPFNPTSTTSVTLVSDLHADGIFDVCEGHDGSYSLVAWKSTATNNCRFARITASGTAENSGDTGSAVTIDYISCYANEDRLVVAHIDNAGATVTVDFVDAPSSLLEYDQGHTDNSTSSDAFRCTVILDSTNFHVLWSDNTGVNIYDGSVYHWTGTAPDDAGTVAQETVIHGALGSQAFLHNDEVYYIVKHRSHNQLQNCYFIMKHNAVSGELPSVVGQMHYGEGLNLWATGSFTTLEKHLPSVWPVGDDNFSFAGGFRRRFKINTSTQFGLASPSLVDTDSINFQSASVRDLILDMNPTEYTFECLNESIYTPGGFIWEYDGSQMAEQGFLLWPELDLDIGATSHDDVGGSVGNIPSGTYSYRIYYEWVNDLGHRIRSFGLQFSYAVVTSEQIEITLPNLIYTLKDDVIITVYRTEVGGTTFYRVTDLDPTNDSGDNRFVFNDRTAQTQAFVDDAVDSTIVTNEIDPGETVLQQLSLPAGKVIASSRRRMYLAGGTIPDNRIYYSKLLESGKQVEFNDRLYVDIDSKGGPVTALSELNDAIVVFKENHIYAINGDGPNNLGQGNFQEPVELTTDVGCTEPRSLVEIPQGIMFKSARGIYLLSGQGVSYIGEMVEAYNSQTITSAEILPEENVVYFLTDEGVTLVYDYLVRQWSVFTNFIGSSAIVWNDNYVYLNDDLMYISNKEKFTDGTSTYAFRLKTGPLRPEQLQGEFLCRRVYILGEYYSDHQVKISIYKNRGLAPNDEKTFDVSDFIDSDTWGDQATWGADDVWGGTGADYQFSYAPADIVYQSLNVEITEVPDTVPGRSFELTELALEWSPMKRSSSAARLGNARRG